jgi:hypothetical protein
MGRLMRKLGLRHRTRPNSIFGKVGSFWKERNVKERVKVPAGLMSEAVNEVFSKLKDRMQQHGDGSYIGAHEALGIIAEEWDELKDAVRSNDEGDVIKEMVDIAVGCVFGIASLRANRQARLDAAEAERIRLEDAAARRMRERDARAER